MFVRKKIIKKTIIKSLILKRMLTFTNHVKVLYIMILFKFFMKKQ